MWPSDKAKTENLFPLRAFNSPQLFGVAEIRQYSGRGHSCLGRSLLYVVFASARRLARSARPQKVYKFPSECIYLSNDSYIPVVREVYTFWERMGIGYKSACSDLLISLHPYVQAQLFARFVRGDWKWISALFNRLTMYELITYDVQTSDAAGVKRLCKVARLCQNKGQRVQNSVFECSLSYAELLQLRADIDAVGNASADRIHI